MRVFRAEKGDVEVVREARVRKRKKRRRIKRPGLQ